MAGSYNKIILIGNLGRDPEARPTGSGDMVASFSVATTERTGKGDVTTWFRVSAFGTLAETCAQYLRKGSYAYIEGTLSQHAYTSRDGQVRQSLEIRAREMRLLDKAGAGQTGQRSDSDDTPDREARTGTGLHANVLVDDGEDVEDTNDAPF